MKKTWLFVLAATSMALTACTQVSAEEPVGPETRDLIVDWTDSSKTLELDGGWTISACEGDGLFLCVSRDGSIVGTIAAASYPITSFDFVDPTADTDTILRAVATDYLSSFEQDRLDGCGEAYGFRQIRPSKFTLDGQSGLTYGFSGTMADGAPSELHHQFSTVVGDQLVLIIASAYDEGGCPGPDVELNFTSATLAEFRPWLDRILQSSPLPPIG